MAASFGDSIAAPWPRSVTMRISVLLRILVLILCFVLPNAAGAAPITWTLATLAPALSPPGVGGTFTYDADTGQMLSWNLHQCINMDCGTLEPRFVTSPSCPSCSATFAFSLANGQYLYTFASTNPQGSQRDLLTLALSSPLTNAGGVLPLISGSLDGTGSFYAMGNTAGGALVIFPFVDGTVSSVPEPGFGAAAGLFLILAAAGYRFRRRF